jgi:hypothetical protein
VRNSSLWLDLRIAMMTIKLLLRGRVSSQENLADTEQVRIKTACGFACSSPALMVPPHDDLRTSALTGEAQQISAEARQHP